VADDAGIVHAVVEAGHRRTLATVFGHVQVERLAYRHRGHQNLHPADAALNLPDERHSHGLRRLAAIESTRGSFEQASAAITRASGQGVGKRQVEELTARTRSTSTTSTPPLHTPSRPRTTCWSCPPTARAS